MKKITSFALTLLLLLTACMLVLVMDTAEARAMDYPTKGWYTNSKYTVGEDIPAGEYIMVGTKKGQDMYFSLKGMEAGELLNGFAVTQIFDCCVTRRYITLKDGQKLELKHAKLIEASKMPAYEPQKEGVWPGGMYKVGHDIPAGTYKVSAPKDKRSPTRILHIPNASQPTEHVIVMPGKSRTFTVYDGNYIQLQLGGTMTMVSAHQ